ncbi:phosphatidylinositol-glycan biosynthesis class X protein [Carlito syrichta]|uniref:Phosphatidylinositol-glycan biosynthesis class X protein n=1 Tax=Carlito syrichta TaxID=1868482 RepID=A0A3Q0EAG7_CARSF|nr:phosphatidylinositol-glycan biosynthesis class X protein [Carlito syrichta]
MNTAQPIPSSGSQTAHLPNYSTWTEYSSPRGSATAIALLETGTRKHLEAELGAAQNVASRLPRLRAKVQSPEGCSPSPAHCNNRTRVTAPASLLAPPQTWTARGGAARDANEGTGQPPHAAPERFGLRAAGAPLGRAPSGVLAAWVVAVRAVAWQLLWAASGLTPWPAAAFLAAPSDAGLRATCSEIILKQEVLKDGFHRDLSIKVKFGESIEDLQTCRLLIKQRIPTGLFVDPYELASLRERNITEAVMVSENFNIEAPNYLSKESEVLIYARQDSQCSDCFQAFLPVHYRYHRPHSKDGETFVVVNNPDLLMYCDQEFPILTCWAQEEVTTPCDLKNSDICQWKNMKYKSVFKNVTLQIPVGLTIHTSLVCSVTLLITILCSTWVLVTVCKYGHFSL